MSCRRSHRARPTPRLATKCRTPQGRTTSEALPRTAEVHSMVVGKPHRAIGHQGKFTQGPAACQTDRRRPLRQGPIGFPTGWPLRKWLVRQRVCRCGADESLYLVLRKLDTFARVSATKEL